MSLCCIIPLPDWPRYTRSLIGTAAIKGLCSAEFHRCTATARSPLLQIFLDDGMRLERYSLVIIRYYCLLLHLGRKIGTGQGKRPEASDRMSCAGRMQNELCATTRPASGTHLRVWTPKNMSIWKFRIRETPPLRRLPLVQASLPMPLPVCLSLPPRRFSTESRQEIQRGEAPPSVS